MKETKTMKKSHWQIRLGVILIALSAIFYLIHYAIFRDARFILLYFIGDVAFVFVEVLLVTLIINEVLNRREKQTLMEKLNMVIGAFFSEWGPDCSANWPPATPVRSGSAGS